MLQSQQNTDCGEMAFRLVVNKKMQMRVQQESSCLCTSYCPSFGVMTSVRCMLHRPLGAPASGLVTSFTLQQAADSFACLTVSSWTIEVLQTECEILIPTCSPIESWPCMPCLLLSGSAGPKLPKAASFPRARRATGRRCFLECARKHGVC